VSLRLVLWFLFGVSFHLVAFSQDVQQYPSSDSSLVALDSLTKKPIDAPEYRNSISSGFRYERFLKNYSDRTFFHVQYGRHFSKADWLVKALQYTLGDLKGYQFESELYVRFKKPGYLYFDAAYSDASILPNYRLRTELFLSAGRFDYSFGAGIVKPFQFEIIPVVTGTMGYYFGDYYVYARPTFTYVEEGLTKSFFAHARRYFTKTDFLSLSILRGADTGTSRSVTSIANSFGNNTYLFRLQGQLKQGPYKLGAGIDHGGIYIPERSEYAPFLGFDVSINRSF
jgi:YaiO family outer membrane protein